MNLKEKIEEIDSSTILDNINRKKNEDKSLDNIESMSIGAGNKSLHIDSQGLWMGSEKFEDAPFSVTMAGELSGTSTGGLDTTAVVNLVYPVGSIYISVTSTNPGSLFGGTWEAFGTGKTLVGIDTADADFDTVEKTGGAKTVTLTSAQSGLPSHNHIQNAHTHIQNAHYHDIYAPSSNLAASGTAIGNELVGSGKDAGKDTRNATATNQNTTATNIANTAADASSPHTNLQPYIVVYFWQRTA
jgi:microcystin-dependent protein